VVRLMVSLMEFFKLIPVRMADERYISIANA